MKSAMPRIVEILGITILAIFFAILVTFPSVLRLNNAYIGDGGDNYEYASYMGLAVKHIQSGALPFIPTNYWRFPVGFEFSRGFDSYLTVTLGTLLTYFIGLPLSYNLTILIIMTLNGLFSYLFFKKLAESIVILGSERTSAHQNPKRLDPGQARMTIVAGDFTEQGRSATTVPSVIPAQAGIHNTSYLLPNSLLGILGMVIYGFSFYTIAKSASHPNLLFIGGIPFLFWSFMRIISKKTPKFSDFLLFFSSFLLISIGSIQYLLMVLIFIPFWILLSFLIFGRASRHGALLFLNHTKSVLFSGAAITIYEFILFFPYIKSLFNGTITITGREDTLTQFTPSLQNFFLPNLYLPIFITKLLSSSNTSSIEKAVFIGFIELVLLVLFFVFIKSKRVLLFLTAFITIPFILALGYGADNSFPLLPYRFIKDIFPFQALAEPGRYYIIFYFFITAAIVLFLKKIKLHTVFLLIILLLLSLERLPYTFYSAPSYTKEAYTPIVEAQQSAAVFDVPIKLYYPQYNILSLYYKKPILNGYFHWSADGEKEKSFLLKDNLLSRYTCSETDPIREQGIDLAVENKLDQRMFELLKAYNIKTIVLHKDDKYFHPVCKNVRMRVNRLIPFITRVIPTAEEKYIKTEAAEGKPSFTLFSSVTGTLYLDGVYIAAASPLDFIITVNNAPATFDYQWEKSPEGNSLQLKPSYKIAIPLTAGSTVTFYARKETSNTLFSAWYRFTQERNSLETASYTPPLKKIFSSEKTEVYQIQ